jgi:NAD(P)-dependent dehydrogenase (short-subunit alcohol dehydrogenase family)
MRSLPLRAYNPSKAAVIAMTESRLGTLPPSKAD